MLVCNGELIVDNVRGVRLRGSIKCSWNGMVFVCKVGNL